MHPVIANKSADGIRTMLPSTASNITCHTDIKRTIALAGEYVHARTRVAALLPAEKAEITILDVGAGPLTVLGKTAPGKKLMITAVDPLADEYDRLLAKYGTRPIVRTRRSAAERLTKHFPADSFDLCYARNCLDHAVDPVRAITQMVEAAKPGCHVLLEHHPNEAENNDYMGLHHWNFSMSGNGHFVIKSKKRITDMTETLVHCSDISCDELREDDEDWLIVRMRKK
jgi:SAM-dependent methyltransferase